MKKYSNIIKIGAVLMAVAMLAAGGLLAFNSDGGEKPEYSQAESSEIEQKPAAVTVAVDFKGEELVNYNGEVLASTAMKTIEKALEDSSLTFEESGGRIIKIGENENTETEGWIFYINDNIPAMNASAIYLKEGDKVLIKWGNLEEAYGKEEESLEESEAEESSAA